MKQYIFESDLNQLSEKGKEKLGKWLEKKGFCNIISGHLLSIGQLIEFLEDYDNYDFGIYDGGFIYRYREYKKQKDGSYKKFNYKWHIGAIENKELCDALFEAVKEILEK